MTVGGVQKTLEYDLNGNLRFEKDANRTVLRAFDWDAINRLVKISDGNEESFFEYDALDRRVRIIEKISGAVQSESTYLWSGNKIIQKRAANGQTIQRNYFADGFEEGGNDYFYTRDHLGSVREVVASDGTTVESVYDYSPWGEVSQISGTGVESDFLYTGHFFHEMSELHFTLYRAYNPELGMWLSRDPIAENGGFNLYAYVGNDPINWFDPDGLAAVPSAEGSLQNSLGNFDGEKAGLNKAGRIIDAEGRMADELVKRKKPGFFKKCKAKVGSAFNNAKGAARWAAGKPLSIYSSAKNALKFGPSAASGGASIIQSRRALDAAIDGDWKAAQGHIENARGLGDVTDKLTELAQEGDSCSE